MAQAHMATQPVQAYPTMRRWPRLRIHVPVTVIVRKENKTVFFQARGQDLNEGGIGVFVGTELRIGDLVDISFTPPYQGSPMSARAVVRNRRGYTYGMEFLSETDEDKKRMSAIQTVLHTMRIE